MSESKPKAAYTTQRMGWDIWLDVGDLGAECLTHFTSSSETEAEAWEKWEQYLTREKLNIKNYGFKL